jgi:hypothetical protein
MVENLVRVGWGTPLTIKISNKVKAIPTLHNAIHSVTALADLKHDDFIM